MVKAVHRRGKVINEQRSEFRVLPQNPAERRVDG